MNSDGVAAVAGGWFDLAIMHCMAVGDSFCFRPWPERLEPSPATLTQIFRGNLSLPDSGWTRIVCIFDLSYPNGWARKNLIPRPLPTPLFDTPAAHHPPVASIWK